MVKKRYVIGLRAWFYEKCFTKGAVMFFEISKVIVEKVEARITNAL